MNKKAEQAKYNEADIKAAYALAEGYLKSLSDEVRFILEKRLKETDIKIHGIDDRVKSIESILAKAQRIECAAPLDEIKDIVGLRVVCLFRDDLPKIGALIEKNFTLLSKDDKLEVGDISGYQSVHFICELPDGLAGARYEHIKNKPFELQI